MVFWKKYNKYVRILAAESNRNVNFIYSDKYLYTSYVKYVYRE